ncbi:acyl-CoA thioesterase/bile acid-CoA:amino acid N-acyltransferase family protein [Herbaspirillum sp. YR522]|uniref:acyl-CoA thioesterase/bile acid-CoA:amino acid N-acyltransferase family protein n=1 Tax=Herbaspirillum sp. YR522 TaxID=1144342 RepID=UPI00026F99D1|nr:acyl-CoA thioesterase/bile acid-CoA:amino acid N-acyltransferase family protein [Herbaspirillum sp. YR522]EJN06627.1 acyl-CoA thioester hydrolase/bile acid-CoA acetyltransferase [Herbaspirillum sp. YR522]
MSDAPELLVTPASALVDRPRRIGLSGFTPRAQVLLRSTLAHPDGSRWESAATFAADAQGRVDLARQAPLRGDWQLPDASAPLWSLRRLSAPASPALSEGLAPLTVTLHAADQAGRQATAQLELLFVAPGVTRREVVEDGLAGALFTPAGPGPHPLVLVLAGSGGGLHEQRAALYAAHGYAALALGYFKTPGRPDHIGDMPLEYFETALRWARRTLAPRHDFVAVSGVSRGGELALLLGATYPHLVSAVIAYVPSAYLHGTLRAGRPDQARDATVWTLAGQGLPNAWKDNPHADWTRFDHPAQAGLPIRQAAAFQSVMGDVERLAAARIAVERIRAPVLLVSGTDDGFWPSTQYAEQVVDTLQARSHAWPVEHVVGVGAGHAIGVPQLPATLIAKPHPVSGVVLDGGGTAAANALASERSWRRVLGFLARAAGARR